MKNLQFLSLICISMFMSMTAAAQEDVEGGKDLPYFTRMPNYHLMEFFNKDFDACKMFDGKNMVSVEGKVSQVTYQLNEGVGSPPSLLQIRRNYHNAITKAGGKIRFEGTSDAYEDTRAGLELIVATMGKGGKTLWVEVAPGWGGEDLYSITVVEVQAMRQDVTATDMLDALNSAGFVALDIHFDTGKATIREESQPLVDQIVSLMKSNTDLKLSIEGHTDNVGDAMSNRALSENRAKAVLTALVKAGVASGRLTAVGIGQERPVADNRTEEGRAKNRRVELVKK